ncbi:UNVERIFIED_CONTAM: hypothetical protein K2H54_003679 [Gekko kuhli]
MQQRIDRLERKISPREKLLLARCQGARAEDEDRCGEETLNMKQFFLHSPYRKTTELLTKLALDPSQSTSCHAEGYGLGSTPWARSRAYKELQRQEEDRKLQEMKEEQRRKSSQALVNKVLPFPDFLKSGDPLLQALNVLLQKPDQLSFLTSEVCLLFREENKHNWKGAFS